MEQGIWNTRAERERENPKRSLKPPRARNPKPCTLILTLIIPRTEHLQSENSRLRVHRSGLAGPDMCRPTRQRPTWLPSTGSMKQGDCWGLQGRLSLVYEECRVCIYGLGAIGCVAMANCMLFYCSTEMDFLADFGGRTWLRVDLCL